MHVSALRLLAVREMTNVCEDLTLVVEESAILQPFCPRA